jgi:hypothetical protein
MQQRTAAGDNPEICRKALSEIEECRGIEMRRMLGFTGSHVLYFLADRVDAVMQKTGSRWLFPLYSKLLVRSADVESWGGGGGAWGAMWAGQK